MSKKKNKKLKNEKRSKDKRKIRKIRKAKYKPRHEYFHGLGHSESGKTPTFHLDENALTPEELNELRNESVNRKIVDTPEGQMEILMFEEMKNYRRTILPDPPKGFPEMNIALSHASADYERMLLRPPNHAIVLHHLKTLMNLPQGEQHLSTWQVASCQKWIEDGKRTVYPTAEIVDACKHTDAMKGVYGEDIKTTLPSFLLVMPEGTEWENSSGATVSHIIVNIMEDQDIVARFASSNADVSLKMPSKRYIMLSIYWDDFGVQNMSVPMDEDGLPIGELLRKYTEEDHHIAARSDTLLSEEELLSDSECGYEISDFVCNVLLIMQSYPEYVTTKEKKMRGLDSKKKNKKVKVATIATPSNLRQSVEFNPSDNKDSKGGKAPDRKTHIRRGHWRRQRHKPNWEIDNRDIPVVIMPDGGHAHMKWIRPLVIRCNEDKETNE